MRERGRVRRGRGELGEGGLRMMDVGKGNMAVGIVAGVVDDELVVVVVVVEVGSSSSSGANSARRRGSSSSDSSSDSDIPAGYEYFKYKYSANILISTYFVGIAGLLNNYLLMT